MTQNWKESTYPFKNFTEGLTQQWIDKGFDKKATREWLESGLQSRDAKFARWLRDDIKINSEQFLENYDKEGLRKKYGIYLNNVREWRYHGFNYEIAKERFSNANEAGFQYWLLKVKGYEHGDGITVDTRKNLRKEYDEECVNWEAIHPSFDPKFYEWKGVLISGYRKRTLEGLEDYCFAFWLKSNNKSPKDIKENIIKLKKEFINEIWGDINLSFDEVAKKKWEEFGFDYKQVKEWVNIGKLAFNEYELATYLKKWKGYTPHQVAGQLDSLREDFYNAQNYLERAYFSTFEKSKIKKIKIGGWWLGSRGLIVKGSLVIENLPTLEDIEISANEITELRVSNCQLLTIIDASQNCLINLVIKGCPNIKRIIVDNNKLTQLVFLDNLNPEKLVSLSVSENKFAPQDLSKFSEFTNLYFLSISKNSFYGSLRYLQNIRNLEYLFIEETNVNSDIEYLPPKINNFGPMTKNRFISPQIDKDLGNFISPSPAQICGREDDPVIKTSDFFYHKLWPWRKEQPGFKELQKILTQINPALDIQEVIKQFHFFNVKNGFFQGNLKDLKIIFQANIERTEFLEKTIKELKSKILEAYSRLAPESDLLQELINAQLVYRKASEQNQPVIKLQKIKQNFYNKLVEVFDEGRQMEEVELILKDCEKLVINDLELEAIITRTDKVIEEAKIRMVNMVNINNINIEGEIVAHQGHIMIGNIISEVTEEIESLNVSANISNASTEKGHVVINNKFGNRTNFSYDTITKITRKPETKENWTELHSSFSNSSLVQNWTDQGFTYSQVNEWIQVIGKQDFNPYDPSFLVWLRDIQNLTSQEVKDFRNLETLKEDYQSYLTQIEITLK